MHGRVKIRTTEEQKETARREKIKKAKAFKETMNLIVEKRSSGIDDQDGLNLTAGLLTGNPDIITLWNYRREILIRMKDESDSESYQKLLEKDLNLTEQCLRVNPKSYGSWHHRTWVLDNFPRPDWKGELNLCTKYLRLDERNFHCWDYRRTVAERSNVSDVDEYEFTTEKIETNFSNYSAWHLRSKLLPRIFPDPEGRFPVDETKHREELELVESAAFTDPNDQSAWFYLRWLLGVKEPKTSILRAERDEDILVLTSKSVRLEGDSLMGTRISVQINSCEAKGSWTSQTSHQPLSCLWKFKPDSKVKNPKNVLPTDSIELILHENGCEYERLKIPPEGFVSREANFLAEISPDLEETMTNQLRSCDQLIELEPDSKWTLLTRIFLMIRLDGSKYESEIKLGLKRLAEIDPMRKGYYLDLRSKILLQLSVRKEKEEKSHSVSGENLTCVYLPQYLHRFEEIDLSRNDLSSDSIDRFYLFLNCKRLDLSGNKIKNLTGLPILPKLETLSIADNLIEQIDFDRLKQFPRLKRVDLRNNPIVDKIDLTTIDSPEESNSIHWVLN